MKNLCKKAWRHTLALFLILMVADFAFGQAPEESPAPRLQPPAPLLWSLDPLGQGMTFSTPCAPNEDNNGALLIGNPLLDSGYGTPGWVAGLEVGIIVPHLESQLRATVPLASGATDTFGLPAGPLGVNAFPKVELGYRWGQASGEVDLSWRGFAAASTHQFPPELLSAFGGAPLTTRLNLNIWDLDYASHEPITVFGLDMKWRAGLRGILFYSDMQAANDLLFQHIVNNYWGVGPHGMVDFRRPFRSLGLELFGRIDNALPFGRVNQKFVEVVTPAAPTDFGQLNQFNNVEILTLGFQAGVSWAPPWNPNFHVTAAYGYEMFRSIGTVFAQPSPTETLWLNGCFLRAEWKY